MDMGDLFVSEEEIGILLLNFVPNPDFQTKLNQVFSVYKPTTLPDKITFADLQELDKEGETQHPYDNMSSLVPLESSGDSEARNNISTTRGAYQGP